MQEGHVLTPEDVIALSQRHVPERYILRQIDDAGVDYVLTPEDHKRLEKARVSPAVIDALVAASDDFSGHYAGPRHHVYVSAYPYPYYDPYDYYGPYPYPYPAWRFRVSRHLSRLRALSPLVMIQGEDATRHKS